MEDRTSLTVAEALSRPTISVPDAGRLFFDLERNGAYEAARRGDIPTIKLGPRLMRVPMVALAEKLGLKTTIGEAA